MIIRVNYTEYDREQLRKTVRSTIKVAEPRETSQYRTLYLRGWRPDVGGCSPSIKIYCLPYVKKKNDFFCQNLLRGRFWHKKRFWKIWTYLQKFMFLLLRFPIQPLLLPWYRVPIVPYGGEGGGKLRRIRESSAAASKPHIASSCMARSLLVWITNSDPIFRINLLVNVYYPPFLPFRNQKDL